MNMRQKLVTLVLAVGIGLGGGFALAESTPAASKKAPSAPKGEEHADKPCCDHHQGMHEGMHGDKEGGESCPMMGMDKLAAEVKVEKTQNGAVIRLSAKNPADVAKVQKMALMIGMHLGADAAALLPPSTEPATKH